MYTHEDRILLETAIISEILFDPNDFIKVSSILSPQNFSDTTYRSIYQACEQLYPNDIITIVAVQRITGLSLKELVIERPFDGRLSQNIIHNAFTLLEWSIRGLYIQLIKKLVNENPSAEKAGDLQEIYEFAINPEADTLKNIANNISYLKDKPEYQIEYSQINDFNETVVKKCEKIRNQIRVKALYYNLENLYHFDYRKKDLLKTLSEVTRYVMSAPELPADVVSKILTLSKLS